MYILKYAFKSIQRSVVRNILIGFVIFLVTISSVVALSIRHSANDIVSLQKENFEIKASLSLDRNLLREKYAHTNESMRTLISLVPPLLKDELNYYADSEHVESIDFNLQSQLNSYTLIPVGASEVLSPPSSDEDNRSNNSNPRGDFIFTGFTSPDRINEFIEGKYVMKNGSAYSFIDDPLKVLISEDLAHLNNLNLDDTITFFNPINDEETYTWIVGGIYSHTDVEEDNSLWSPSSYNQIIVNFNTLNDIVEKSNFNPDSPLNYQLFHTFYLTQDGLPGEFQIELSNKGLSDLYRLRTNHSDLEQAMRPLDNLIKFSSIFFWIVLVVSALILFTINMINIRERKYEIGVLRAMGMKKRTVAYQFLLELFIVAFLTMGLGIASGSIASEPVANHMLSSEIEQLINEEETIQSNLGNRSGQGQGANRDITNLRDEKIDYINEIKTTLTFPLLIQIVFIGLLIILLGSGLSLVVISRYEPLKILNNRT